MTPQAFLSWECLREWLNAAAKANRGLRAAIAREHHVSKSAVTQWLKGGVIPSGDIALALQKLADGPPGTQDKARRSVTSTAASRKAKSSKPSYEQTRHGPPPRKGRGKR